MILRLISLIKGSGLNFLKPPVLFSDQKKVSMLR